MSEKVMKDYAGIAEYNRNMVTSLAKTINKYVENDEEKIAAFSKLKSCLAIAIKNLTVIECGKEIYSKCESYMEQENITEEEETEVITKAEKEYKKFIKTSETTKFQQELFAEDATMQTVNRNLEILKASENGSANENCVMEDDDEIVATQHEINLIDPISKTLMQQPVRHICCGHVYDKSTVLQMIKQNRRKGFRCPAMGCTHREPIEVNDLEEAIHYEREIIKRKRNGTYHL